MRMNTSRRFRLRYSKATNVEAHAKFTTGAGETISGPGLRFDLPVEARYTHSSGVGNDRNAPQFIAEDRPRRKRRRACRKESNGGRYNTAPAWQRLFPAGFRNERIKTSGAEINAVIGGSGPPVLMFHGAPQSLITWRLIAPDLAKDYTLVMCDLRGYGDSSRPRGGGDHSDYSKRPMALDGVEVMKHLGYNQFRMVGHDRGGRVGRRMALDHPDKVTKLAVLDIVPAHYLYSHVTIEFVQAYFHWFNYLRPAPGPENETQDGSRQSVGAAADNDEIQLEYLREQHRSGDGSRDVRGLSRLGFDRSEKRRGGYQGGKENPVPAAGSVGGNGRDGQALRCARHLEGRRSE